MDRRAFLWTVTAGIVAAPAAPQAQPKVARIGFLYFGSRQSALDSGRYQMFVQGMRELGYVEGTNLVIEARFADGKPENLPALAAELVRLKVDVIVGHVDALLPRPATRHHDHSRGHHPHVRSCR